MTENFLHKELVKDSRRAGATQSRCSAEELNKPTAAVRMEEELLGEQGRYEQPFFLNKSAGGKLYHKRHGKQVEIEAGGDQRGNRGVGRGSGDSSDNLAERLGGSRGTVLPSNTQTHTHTQRG